MTGIEYQFNFVFKLIEIGSFYWFFLRRKKVCSSSNLVTLKLVGGVFFIFPLKFRSHETLIRCSSSTHWLLQISCQSKKANIERRTNCSIAFLINAKNTCLMNENQIKFVTKCLIIFLQTYLHWFLTCSLIFYLEN